MLAKLLVKYLFSEVTPPKLFGKPIVQNVHVVNLLINRDGTALAIVPALETSAYPWLRLNSVLRRINRPRKRPLIDYPRAHRILDWPVKDGPSPSAGVQIGNAKPANVRSGSAYDPISATVRPTLPNRPVRFSLAQTLLA